MKKIVCSIAFLVFASVSAQTELTGTITVKTEKYRNEKGFAMIALHNTPKTFLKKAAPFRKERVAIVNGVASATFKDIPFGTYSVAVFHDENDNFDLDANFVGIPKEDYGFSNNARKKYGPPSYKDTLFELSENEKTLTIQVAPAM